MESHSFAADYALNFLEIEKWKTNHFYSKHFSERKALIDHILEEAELFLSLLVSETLSLPF